MKAIYDTDFLAWTREQADALDRRSANELDWENLREEIDSLGKSLKRELGNRLRVLNAHLLKWNRQPDMRSNSWVYTVEEQRRSIIELLDDNPSLRRFVDDEHRGTWRLAVLDAAYETGYHENMFPHAPNFDFEHAMSVSVEMPEPQRRSSTRKTKA